jgi:hypothetical protein
MPGQDPAIELQDLLLEPPQLGAKGGETGAHNLRHALVVSIRDDSKQLFNTLASDRGYDPELSHVSTDCIDHRGLLADEELACAMEHQATLLFGRLGLDKPHVGPGHRFTDGLGVSGIVLLPLDIGLYVAWRHQAHGMPERLELARPMMRRGTGLDANKAWRKLLEERQDVPALQLTADEHVPRHVNTMHLKH